MRVALIGPLPPELGGATPGGVATHQAHLAAGLRELSALEVFLLATNVRQPLKPSLRAVRYAAHLARLRTDGSRRELLGNLLRYARFLEQAQPQVIHVQHPLERMSFVRQVRELEPRLVTAPLVVTAHSFFGEHDDTVIYGLMAPNLAAATRVIAVSPHIADQAVQLGVARERVRVIPSGVDTERFSPRDRDLARQRLDIAGDVPLVLFVGNLEPRKQLDVLLRALVAARKLVQRVCLAVVGTGASAGALDQTDRLKQLTRELNLGDAVRFVGRVDEADLVRWYAAADVFALPSSSEAQGIVALEAMACGLPVVASAVGGLLGTIEDGVSGYLVPAGEAEPLADRLAALLTDARSRAAMGAAARARVVADFTWSSAVARTLEVYREVAACRAR